MYIKILFNSYSMRKFLCFHIFCSCLFLWSPFFSQAQTPGTKISGSQYLYHGTLSNRNINGTPTWDYLGAPGGAGTNFNSSPYEDFHFHKNQYNIMNYRMLFPEGYISNPSEKYPIVIMLHGKGEGGAYGLLKGGYSVYPETTDEFRNNDHQLINGGEVHLRVVQGTDNQGPNGTPREFPGFVLFPQSERANEFGWNVDERNRLIEIIEELLVVYPIDPNRIYIHGLSMGGTAVWNVVNQRPDLFAAMLPMSAVRPPSEYDYQKVATIPTWLFQGSLDPAPKAERAVEAINLLKSLGGTPRYTEYADLGHATWNRAYNEDDFFSWMLGNSKLSIHAAFGDTLFCEGEEINTTLSVSPGFAEYKWRKDGVDIPNSNSNTLEIVGNESVLGSYQVQIRRSTAYSPGWTEWSSSPATVLGIKPPTPVALIQANGSTTLPSLDGATTVELSVPEGYEAYTWQNEASETNSITVSEGTFRVQVTEKDGCPSNFSPAVIVTNNGPTDIIVTPGNFSAEPVSSTRINLFWNDLSDNETGFEIYRATSPGGAYQFVTKTKDNITYFADEGISPNTVYYYKMRAVNNSGSSGYTAEISSETGSDAEAPTPPRNVTAKANLDLTSITLSWNSASDNDQVKEYIIYQVNGNNTTTEIGVVDDTTFTHTGLSAETTYTYYVAARDNSNNVSLKSNQVTTTTIFCGLQYTLYTGKPYNSVNDFEPNQIKETGNIGNFYRTPAIAYYAGLQEPEVYFGFSYQGYILIETPGTYRFWTTSDDGSTLSIDNTEVVSNDKRQGTTTKFGDITLSAGAHPITVKYFQATGGHTLAVEYRGPDGSGIARQAIPSSVLCSSEGVAIPPSPEIPTNLTATAVSENQINLSWMDNSSDETGFEIHRSKNNQANYELIGIVDPEASSYEDTGLEASTTYYYKIRAISVNGESPFTDDAGKLQYAYYEGTWDNLPNFAAINPVKTGTTANFDLSLRNQDDRFAFKFDGKIKISETGSYTFFTKSDDGSELYIGNTSVVQNDGLHGSIERSGTFNFNSPGIYDISVRYFEKTGGELLEVRYQGPEISKQLIPDAALSTGVVMATTEGDSQPPTTPEDLAVKSVSATSVGLTWLPSTDNVKVVGYNVYRVMGTGNLVQVAITDELGDVLEEENDEEDTEDVNSVNFISAAFGNSLANGGMSVLSEEAITAVTRISSSIGGLTSGTDYKFVVKARDAAGNLSAASNEVTFTTGEEAPLPIELVDFFAIPQEDYIQINWITASETNNDYFVVLRSLDGKEFKEIGTVDGAGDSNSMLYYVFNDELPINGIMYYQLKQVDTNGVFAVSDIIRAEYKKDNATFDLKVYPNPVKNSYFKLHLTSSNEESDVHLKITDMVGKIYLDKFYPVEDLLNILHFSKAELSGGMYIISIQQGNQKLQKKLIIE